MVEINHMESFKEFIGNIEYADQPAVQSPNATGILNTISNGKFPTLDEAEDFLIKEALNLAKGNQGIAASMLGISRQALNKRIARNKHQ
ncbi:MAG: hypothetical protein EPN22_04175 [Nitrospirae bacterium]|nr:MAG: hypothetical protein EPN22_04175 [Nitrospirota bacterium]